MSQVYSLPDLLKLMQQLRDPENGCPWDKKQTFQSLTSYTIEEAYEVTDAIEQNDLSGLKSELGDLLFQVIFYSQIAKEQDLFDFDDVVQSISEKLVRRHPHVLILSFQMSRLSMPIGKLKKRKKDKKKMLNTPVFLMIFHKVYLH